MNTRTILVIVTISVGLSLLASSGIVSNIALAKLPIPTITTEQTILVTNSPVNGGLNKQETTTTTITTTTTCANHGGQAPQAANCPGPHSSKTIDTSSTTTCDGVSNKAGKGSPVGPSPC